MKTKYIMGGGYDPYLNLAVEEYLLDHVEEDTVLLYLWQNRHTVVIGRNQNCWSECRVRELERDGGHLARRLSGGGAVYHDLGNLNFTFIMNRKYYDLARQLSVIVAAVASAGIAAEKSGRNDIIVDGRKFSGNAFYHRGDRSYHHGTLLIDVDKELLGKYLNVAEDKLQAHGVKSVRSRITNLTEHAPHLTVDLMKENLLEAFGKEYGSSPEALSREELDQKALVALYRKYSSEDWNYGKPREFGLVLSRRFAWGGVDIRLQAKNGRVEEAAVYSDAMDAELISKLPGCLRHCEFSAVRLADSLNGLRSLRQDYEEDAGIIARDMIGDIQDMLREQRL